MSDQPDSFIVPQLPPPDIDQNTLAPTTTPYNLTSNIAYTSNPHSAQHLDIYTPQTPTGPFPLVIYIHGGAFKFGDKVTRLLPLNLLSHNYALASLNYRLSGDAPFPAAVQDCKAATRYLRAHAGDHNLDATRFVVMGESAGAYMACMVGLTGPLSIPLFNTDTTSQEDESDATVRGVVSFYGPTDFSQMDAHAPATATMKHDADDSPESLFLGMPITSPDARDLVQQANPISYVTDNTPPVLVAHGTADKVVPFHQSLLLVEALRKGKREVLLHEVEGVDHVFIGIREEQRRELDRVLVEWLQHVVGK